MADITEFPWSDCKVAFACDDKEAFDIWMLETNDGEGYLPDGWNWCETDWSGARCVVVFRVEGDLRREDGEKVLAILTEIDAGGPIEEGSAEDTAPSTAGFGR
jgi:hypothetical protein